MPKPEKHIVVIGGGTGGRAFVGNLLSRSTGRVTLLEAGPDYGAFAECGWPVELLDTRRMPTTHDWGFLNRDTACDRSYPVERAKVLGGCSSHVRKGGRTSFIVQCDEHELSRNSGSGDAGPERCVWVGIHPEGSSLRAGGGS
jgi:hypothetical protein